MPMALCKEKLWTERDKRWDDQWNKNPDHCKQTKLWFPTCDRLKSLWMLKKMNRREISKATQLITNVSNLKYHQRHNHPTAGIKCRLCKDKPEKGWHLVTNCTGTRNTVERIFTTKNDWSAEELQKFVNVEIIDQLLSTRITGWEA